MWITTITIDLLAFRNGELFNNFGQIIQQINQIKQSFQSPENGGFPVDGLGLPESFASLPGDQNTLVVKRAWNTQSIAQQYADAILNVIPNLIITVEEQV